MTTLLTVLLVIASLIIVAAVLIQPAKGGAMPLGGSSNSVFGSTGGTTFLFRLTMWTAAFIMVVSLGLSRSRVQQGKSSVIDVVPPASAPVSGANPVPAPTTTAPVGSAPATGEGTAAPVTGAPAPTTPAPVQQAPAPTPPATPSN